MKNRDVIKQLRSIQDEARDQAESCHRDGENDTVWDKDVKALDMAIDALEELSKRQTSARETCKIQD